MGLKKSDRPKKLGVIFCHILVLNMVLKVECLSIFNMLVAVTPAQNEYGVVIIKLSVESTEKQTRLHICLYQSTE